MWEAKHSYHRMLKITSRYGFKSFSLAFLAYVCLYWIWLLVSSQYFIRLDAGSIVESNGSSYTIHHSSDTSGNHKFAPATLNGTEYTCPFANFLATSQEGEHFCVPGIKVGGRCTSDAN